MSLDLAPWLTAAVSLAGVWANIHGRRYCFLIFGASNLAWCAIDAWHGIYAQSCLMAIYFGLSVYGWIQWGKRSHA